MKKMLILALIGLFYIACSVMIPPQRTVVDNDVGYSLSVADQNTTPEIILSIENPASYILIDRGVSVPDKCLISSDAIVYNEIEDVEWVLCNKNEWSELKLPTLQGFENQPDKYPFASDLGLRHS